MKSVRLLVAICLFAAMHQLAHAQYITSSDAAAEGTNAVLAGLDASDALQDAWDSIEYHDDDWDTLITNISNNGNIPAGTKNQMLRDARIAKAKYMRLTGYLDTGYRAVTRGDSNYDDGDTAYGNSVWTAAHEYYSMALGRYNAAIDVANGPGFNLMNSQNSDAYFMLDLQLSQY